MTYSTTTTRKPAQYRLKKNRFEHTAGSIVYVCNQCDYGVVNDDNRATGIEHTKVTLDPTGDYPFFTVPVDDLEPFEAIPAACTPGPWNIEPYEAEYAVAASLAPDHQNERIRRLELIGKHRFKALSVGTPDGQVAIIPLDESNEANARLIRAAPDLLEATEMSLARFAWVIDLVNRAVGHLNLDDFPPEAVELLDEVTSSEYFRDDIEAVQFAADKAKGLAA